MRINGMAILETILIGWIAFFSATGVSARPAKHEAASPFLITHWTTENGLPQNSVTTIVQTPDGYLWLGTFGGLARFDGVKFTIFNTGNTPALPSNRITALHVGRDGTLWIGAETGEVTRFRDGSFSLFAHLPAGASGSQVILTIYEDRAGALWVGAPALGVTRFVAGDAARTELYDERSGLPSVVVTSVAEDDGGQLWVCTRGGLARFEPAQEGGTGKFNVQLKRTVPDAPLRISAHPDGGLWMLTQTALHRFYQGRLTLYLNYPYNAVAVAALSQTAGGDLFFGYPGADIFQVGRQVGRVPGAVTKHKLEAAKPEQAKIFTVHALCADREGNVWVGTIGDGLLRLSRRRVTMLQPISIHPEAAGGPILEDRRGDLWFGTKAGLSRLSAGTLSTLFTRDALREQGDWSVDALYQDAAGDVWIGKVNGVARYRDGRFTQYVLPGVEVVQAICEDRRGQLWLGTWRGLARFHNESVTIYRQSDGLVNDDVKFIVEDRAGALWIGTPEGLCRFQDGRFTNYTTSTNAGGGLSNNYVRAVHEDRDGTLWIGTYGGGLNRLRNGRIAHITTRHGLFDDFISRILEGDDDTFWLLGNRGVFQVSRQALNEVADGARPSLTCVVYDKADGMDPSEGQGGVQPAGWRARDGRLYFPTIRGMAIVDPSLASKLPPPVVIERVLLDGAELDAHRLIEIPPGKGNLEIHYTGLSLSKPEQVQFSFQLSGLSEHWKDVGQRRTAYFPQLEPGSYRFSVRALSPDGVWSEQAASLAFVVRPPWWRTTWFRAFAAMALTGLVLVGYRWRMAIYQARAERQEAFSRQLIASQEQERKRIAAELHDGLGQNLLTIKNWARMGSKTLPADNAAQPFLAEIADTTALTIDDVRQMAQNLRPSQLERLGLTSTLDYMVRGVARASGIAFTADLDDIDGMLPPEGEINLFRVVQECANNIVKHSGATEAHLNLKRTATGLTLHCEDNGRGFSIADLGVRIADSEIRNSEVQSNPQSALPNPQSKGFGLRWMQERVNLLGGKMTLRSAPGAGTTIVISIEQKTG